LAAIHPAFYPQPIRFDRITEESVGRFAHVDGSLTEEQFIQLYDVCSRVIHTANPFSNLEPIDFGVGLAAWVDRIHIQTLLDAHFVRMYGSSQVWVVQMKAGPMGEVQVAVAEPKQPA
jgi:hypothetical protein